MLNAFKDIINNQFNGFKNKTVFVATSGGIDSMVLTHLLLLSNIKFTLLHCNFKLRIPDADLDAQFLNDFAAIHKIPIYIKQFDTAKEKEQCGLTIQETARNLRYNWFKTFITNQHTILLTAHHLDDNIETFFINILRGTAIKGLGGIPSNENNIHRPLLSFERSEIDQFAKQHNIAFRQDKSNFDNKYLRNQLRHNIIPLLQEIAPTLNKKLTKTITSANDINQWIEKKANQFREQSFEINNGHFKVNLNQIKSEDAIFIQYIFAPFGIKRSNLYEFINFLTTKTGAIFKTTNFTFVNNRDTLHFTSQPNEKFLTVINKNDLPKQIHINHLHFNIQFIAEVPSQFNVNSHYFDSDKVQFPLTLRNWQNTDKIMPLGMTGTKLISDILINKKLSRIDKSNIYVLIDANNTIISVPTVISANNVKITPDTHNVLKISW